jgi:hypothetical protein
MAASQGSPRDQQALLGGGLGENEVEEIRNLERKLRKVVMCR